MGKHEPNEEKLKEVIIENITGRNFAGGFFKYYDCEEYENFDPRKLRFFTDDKGNKNDKSERDGKLYNANEEDIVFRFPISYFQRENIAMWSTYAPSGVCVKYERSQIIDLKKSKEQKNKAFSHVEVVFEKDSGQERIKLEKDEVEIDFRFMLYSDLDISDPTLYIVRRGGHHTYVKKETLEQIQEGNPVKSMAWCFENELRIYLTIKKSLLQKRLKDRGSNYKDLQKSIHHVEAVLTGPQPKVCSTPFSRSEIDERLRSWGVDFEQSELAEKINIAAYKLKQNQKQ